jgi:hypothetical protein
MLSVESQDLRPILAADILLSFQEKKLKNIEQELEKERAKCWELLSSVALPSVPLPAIEIIAGTINGPTRTTHRPHLQRVSLLGVIPEETLETMTVNEWRPGNSCIIHSMADAATQTNTAQSHAVAGAQAFAEIDNDTDCDCNPRATSSADMIMDNTPLKRRCSVKLAHVTTVGSDRRQYTTITLKIAVFIAFLLGVVVSIFTEGRLFHHDEAVKRMRPSIYEPSTWTTFSGHQWHLLTSMPFVGTTIFTSPKNGFRGLMWTRFLVNIGCGERFRAGEEALFPEKPKINTLYHFYRRSGLVPEHWRRA